MKYYVISVLFCVFIGKLYAQVDSIDISYTKDSMFVREYKNDSLYSTISTKKRRHHFYMDVGQSFINKEALYLQGYYFYQSMPKQWRYQLSLGAYGVFKNGLHTVIPEIGGEIGWKGVALGGYVTPQSIEPRFSARINGKGGTTLYVGYAFPKDSNQEYLNGITAGAHIGMPYAFSIRLGYSYIGRNTFYSEFGFFAHYLEPYIGLHLTKYKGDFKAIVEPGLKCYLTEERRRYLGVGYTSYGILAKVGLLNNDYVDIYTGYAFSTDDRDIVKGFVGGISLKEEFLQIFALFFMGGKLF